MSPVPQNSRASVYRRLLAFAVDWGVFALWAGVIFAIVMLATGGEPPQSESPWIAQAIGFVSVTLPFTLYFALCESSRWRASIGKRALGLIAVRRSGEKLSFARALLRNAIKFAPWEFGHTVVQQAIHAKGEDFPDWLWGPMALAMLGPIWWIAPCSLQVKHPTIAGPVCGSLRPAVELHWQWTRIPLPIHPRGR